MMLTCLPEMFVSATIIFIIVAISSTEADGLSWMTALIFNIVVILTVQLVDVERFDVMQVIISIIVVN